MSILFDAVLATTGLNLHVISRTATTITLGWTPPVNCVGYYFYRDGVKISSTGNGATKTIKFSLVLGATYRVDALAVSQTASIVA